METMFKLCLILFALGLMTIGSAAITISSMIWGWGLTPKSWPIILVCIVGHWAVIGIVAVIQWLIKES